MRIIEKWADVPRFESETEEAAFWSETRLDRRLMHAAIHKSDMRESATVTLRLDPRMLTRIKRLARARYLDHETMIKHWLGERLEKEA